jgi:hypothetical protein
MTMSRGASLRSFRVDPATSISAMQRPVASSGPSGQMVRLYPVPDAGVVGTGKSRIPSSTAPACASRFDARAGKFCSRNANPWSVTRRLAAFSIRASRSKPSGNGAMLSSAEHPEGAPHAPIEENKENVSASLTQRCMASSA